MSEYFDNQNNYTRGVEMKKIAFMFPGQGSQYVGMGQDFYEEFEVSKQVFDTASDLLGMDMKELCFTENDRLNITEYTQCAMLTMIVAVLRVVEEKGVKASVCGGLSLGEYGALVASKAMSFEDAVKVVRQRGILMQEAVPTGLGAMSAVLGLDKEIIEETCSKVDGIVTIANYNCPGQIVISGEVKAVEAASEALKEAGAKRVVPLNVSGPFHSLMLKEAEEKLLKVLDEATIHTPEIPYVANTTADYVTSEEPIKELLGKQVYSSVRWQQSVEKMIADGVDTFIEIGPGRSLSGFMKKIDKSVKVINIDKVADLEKLKEVVTC